MTTPRGKPPRAERRNCSLYLRLINHRTGEAVGDLGDISPDGFKLECEKAVPVNTMFNFQMDLPPDISTKPFIVFTAVSRWCRPDPLDSRLYNVGFEVLKMDLADSRAFRQIFERYGTRKGGFGASDDYLWEK